MDFCVNTPFGTSNGTRQQQICIMVNEPIDSSKSNTDNIVHVTEGNLDDA
jgi:hypothetical protein